MFVYNLDATNPVCDFMASYERFQEKQLPKKATWLIQENLRSGQPIPESVCRRIIKLRQKGESISDVAEKTGYSKPTVCRISRRFGIIEQNPVTHQMDCEIIKLRSQGMKLKDVAARLGICHSTVWKHSRRSSTSRD